MNTQHLTPNTQPLPAPPNHAALLRLLLTRIAETFNETGRTGWIHLPGIDVDQAPPAADLWETVRKIATEHAASFFANAPAGDCMEAAALYASLVEMTLQPTEREELISIAFQRGETGRRVAVLPVGLTPYQRAQAIVSLAWQSTTTHLAAAGGSGGVTPAGLTLQAECGHVYAAEFLRAGGFPC